MEKELDMTAINKIYDMVSSNDAEMRELGISIASSYGIIGESVGHITAVLASRAYNLGSLEAEQIKLLARSIKYYYIRDQNFISAATYRDVERRLEYLFLDPINYHNGKSDSKKDSGSVDE